MNKFIKISAFTCMIFFYNHTNAQHINIIPPTDFVQKLDKQLQLNEDQKEKIIVVKQKENAKIKKYLAKIEKAQLKSKNKISQILNLEQRVQLDKMDTQEINPSNKLETTERNPSNNQPVEFKPLKNKGSNIPQKQNNSTIQKKKPGQ